MTFCFVFCSKCIQYEGRYRRGEFTATVFLENCTNLYGKSILLRSHLWNKPKKDRDRLIRELGFERQETQDADLLDEALDLDREREQIDRARNAIGRSFRDNLVNWHFDFEALPPTKDRHDPHKEKVQICYKCKEELFETLVTTCGCQGFCRTCLQEAQAFDSVCLNNRCNTPFTHFIKVNNDIQTVSREVMELQRMSQEQQLQEDEEEDQQAATGNESDSDNSLHTDVELLSNDESTEEEYHTEDEGTQDDHNNQTFGDDSPTYDPMMGHYLPNQRAGEINTLV